MPKDEIKEVKEDTSKMIKLGDNLVCNDHYFIRQRNNAICTKCPVGYPLGLAEIKDGHIFVEKQLVI